MIPTGRKSKRAPTVADSEDCLFLKYVTPSFLNLYYESYAPTSVYTPKRTSQSLPVVFWIHGGG